MFDDDLWDRIFQPPGPKPEEVKAQLATKLFNFEKLSKGLKLEFLYVGPDADPIL